MLENNSGHRFNSIESPLLHQVPGLRYGFGTRAEPIPGSFLPQWKTQGPIHQQVHGTSISEIHHARQEAGKVDTLYCRQAHLPIGVMTADCVPILLAHESGKTVAAVHGGWRGTKGRILPVLWEHLQKEGESPQEWVAAIGPSIGPCCYEVSQELADEFIQKFDKDLKILPAHRITPKPRFLDLQAIHAAELRRLGLTRVDILRKCTRCSLIQDPNTGASIPEFHSYRREGGGTRQWSVIEAGRP